MNFCATTTSEDDRGASGSRGGSRNIISGLGGGGGTGTGGGVGTSGSGNGRASSLGGSGYIGGGGGDKPGAASLATLDVGARVSPGLPYGKIVSLPAGGGGGGMGLVRGGRHER